MGKMNGITNKFIFDEEESVNMCEGVQGKNNDWK